MLRAGASAAKPLIVIQPKLDILEYYEKGFQVYLTDVYKPQFAALLKNGIVGRKQYHPNLWSYPRSPLLATPGDIQAYFNLPVFNWNMVEDLGLTEFACLHCLHCLTPTKLASKGLHHRLVCNPSSQPYIISARRKICNTCHKSVITYDPLLLAKLPRYLQDFFPATITDKMAVSKDFISQLVAFAPEIKPARFWRVFWRV